MGSMLEQGTKSRSALQLSDAYRDIGAEHGALVDWDSSAAWAKVLPAHVDTALDILADIVRNPMFAKDEIERQRSQRLAAIRQQKDQPSVVLSNTIVRALYQAPHVYSESLLGTEASVKQASRGALQAFHRQVFAPSDVFVVVVGNVQPAGIERSLERVFGSWKQASLPRRPVSSPPAPPRTVVLVDRPGAAQSNIAAASVGVARTTPAFDALLMANTIVGGMFSSRLNLSLRERHGFTYGAYSHFDMRHAAGPFRTGAAVDTPKTGAALREMLSELQRFCSAPATREEMQLALGQQVRSLPGSFETAGDTASSIADVGIFGLPLDEFRTRPTRLAAVTPEQVRDAAARHIDPQTMKVVVVGDRKRIEADLRELKFGPIVVVDERGKTLETVPASEPLMPLSCGPASR
jgi:predicted Zn-dependent peptidase